MGSIASQSQIGKGPQLTAPCKQSKRPPLLTILLALLAVIALLRLIAAIHVAYPANTANNCADLIRNNDYTKNIPQLTRTQQITAVQLVNELTGGQPAAMVQVADTSPQQLLDIYIYGCSMQHPTPMLALLFKQQRLVEGTAVITQAHTLSIGQLDTSLGPDADTQLLPLQQNIYHEYRWIKGALVQTIFPGLYPVTSRSEAEELQDQANKGPLPWDDPLTTAKQMAQDLFTGPIVQYMRLSKTGTRLRHISYLCTTNHTWRLPSPSTDSFSIQMVDSGSSRQLIQQVLPSTRLQHQFRLHHP